MSDEPENLEVKVVNISEQGNYMVEIPKDAVEEELVVGDTIPVIISHHSNLASEEE